MSETMQVEATGFAIVNARTGVIDLRTVSPTKRAAMVNWLYVEIMPVLDSTTDNEIEGAFKRYAKGRALLAKVNLAVESFVL